MTTNPSAPAEAGPSTDATGFARLAQELADLDFVAADDGQNRNLAYATTDSPLVITIDHDAQPPVARVTNPACDGEPGWVVSFTADTPQHTQLIALYAAINADPGPAIDSAAAAVGVEPWGAGTQPVAPVG